MSKEKTAAVVTETEEISELKNISIYHKAKVRIRFRDRILAGIPKRGDSLDYFIDAKFASDEAKKEFRERVKTGELTDEEKQEIKETNWCQFEKSPYTGNLCLWHGNVKAGLRECLITLGMQIKYKGSTTKVGAKQIRQHGIHVNPNYLEFIVPRKEPDGTVLKIKHIEHKGVPVSALGNHDFIEKPELEFELKWPNHNINPIQKEQIEMMLRLFEDDGLGACRSQGYGTFDIVQFDVLR